MVSKRLKDYGKLFFRCQFPAALIDPEPVVSENRHLVVCHEIPESGRFKKGADFFLRRGTGFLIKKHRFGESSCLRDDDPCSCFLQTDLGEKGRHEKDGTVAVG